MQQLIEDFRADCEALKTFSSELGDADWSLKTAFFDWSVADQIMHLHQVDMFGKTALTNSAGFPDVVAEVRAGQASGIELSQRMRDDYGHLQPDDLLHLWATGYEELCDLFTQVNADQRLPWFGPPMPVSAFVTARQMEVWAHGQDVFDLFGVRRENNDRIHQICELGVRTHGWSFKNRRLERPEKPEVRLIAPGGSKWTWNQGQTETISGPAEDFALVVTQRRHVDDTALVIDGVGARSWMEIAQCFAGKPQKMPTPGERLVDYS